MWLLPHSNALINHSLCALVWGLRVGRWLYEELLRGLHAPTLYLKSLLLLLCTVKSHDFCRQHLLIILWTVHNTYIYGSVAPSVCNVNNFSQRKPSCQHMSSGIVRWYPELYKTQLLIMYSHLLVMLWTIHDTGSRLSSSICWFRCKQFFGRTWWGWLYIDRWPTN